jgi:hypothetical protein
MSAAMTAQLVTDALLMAVWRRGKPDALLQPETRHELMCATTSKILQHDPQALDHRLSQPG